MGMPTHPPEDKSVQYSILTVRLNHMKLPFLWVKDGKVAEYAAV